MLAQIYRPARTAMQSGAANTKEWVLEFAAEEAKRIDSLMGWTSSADMNGQVRMTFPTREAAVEFCERYGLPHVVREPHRRKPNVRPKGYGGNFAFERRQPWSH